MNYRIVIETEHPLVDVVILNAAQKIAEEIDFDGSHDFAVTVFCEGDQITQWNNEEGAAT